jgi:predicted SprT family Zn-dependent metalloprotease
LHIVAEPVDSSNSGERRNPQLMLQCLEGLRTNYVCRGCGQHLLRTVNFDRNDMDMLVKNLTGSCPNCRKLLVFEPGNITFGGLS